VFESCSTLSPPGENISDKEEEEEEEEEEEYCKNRRWVQL
jgi:hypothetical protein